MAVEAASAAALRRSYAAALGVAAVVTPFISFVLAGHGWRLSELGTSLALLTIASMVGAPIWGWVDDRMPGLAGVLLVPATVLASIALSVTVLLVPTNRVAVTGAMWCFGFCSGSLEFLVTASVSRARQMHALGSLRTAGSWGWIGGLLAGAATLAAGAGGGVFALGAVAALLGVPAAAAATRKSSGARAHKLSPKSGEPLSVILLVGLPVPIATFTLLYFSAGWVRDSWGDRPIVAITPLLLAAVLEVPCLLLADRLLQRMEPMVAVGWALLLLMVAWTAMALYTHLLTLLIVQPAVALMTALWIVGQSRAIVGRATVHRVGRELAVASAAAKAGAAVVAGAGGGAVAGRLGLPAVFAAEAALAGGALAWLAMRQTKGSDK